VVYTPIVADTKQVIRILESGKNVVTPLNWFYPGRRDVAAVEAACRRGGVTLHGTGIHPGGVTERFPLMVSALSRAITHVRAEEFSDIRSYGAPQVVGDLMLFGKTPEEAARSPMLGFLSGGFLPVDRHGGRRARLRARPGEAHHPRGGGGDAAHRLADRVRSRPAAWRRSASPGRGRCAASR
jgi:hypothetical protein